MRIKLRVAGIEQFNQLHFVWSKQDGHLQC